MQENNQVEQQTKPADEVIQESDLVESAFDVKARLKQLRNINDVGALKSMIVGLEEQLFNVSHERNNLSFTFAGALITISAYQKNLDRDLVANLQEYAAGYLSAFETIGNGRGTEGDIRLLCEVLAKDSIVAILAQFQDNEVYNKVSTELLAEIDAEKGTTVENQGPVEA